MHNQFNHLRLAFVVSIAICFSTLTTAAMPGKTNPLTSTPSVFLSPPLTNAPTPLRNSRKLTMEEWLRQQVAMRTANAAASSGGDAKTMKRNAAVQKLSATAGSLTAYSFHRNGTSSQIKGVALGRTPAKALALSAVQRSESTARTFLQDNRDLLSLKDADAELALVNSKSDELGRRHLLFSQKYSGLPVWPCNVTVHLDPQGNVDCLDGAYIPSPESVATTPTIASAAAVKAARLDLCSDGPSTNTEPELIIYGPLDGAARLAWKFELSAGLTRAWRCVVDAEDGTVLLADSLVADAAVVGSGVDGLSRSRTLNLWQEGSTFYTVDTSKMMYNPSSTPPVVSNTFGAIEIFDAHNTPGNNNPDLSDVMASLAWSPSPTSGWVPDAVGAAFGLSQTYDYYLARHSRNSIDGAGGSIIGIVRVGINYRNAFWQGQLKVMIFGDGFPSALDVDAHELTHGVVNTIAGGQGLIYQNQSGAMNEAIADIFGKSVEARVTGTNNWIIGIGTPLGIIRNMKDPGSLQSGAGPFPSKMSEFIQLSTQQDSGGVHINSTIISHCYYLLVEGLNGALSTLDGEKIFYRALTMHLQPQSQFIDLRHACIAAAEELYGTTSPQALRTAEAFNAVEIIDAPSTPAPSPVPVVSAADSTFCLTFNSGGYRLVRRETGQGDSVNGVFVNTLKFLAHERVSITGNGAFALYATQDGDYGVVNTDGTSPEVNGTPGLVHSLAISPDGKKAAFVLLNAAGFPTNELRVVDLVSGVAQTIHLYATANDGSPQDIISYADTLDFTSDGNKIVYDAYAQTTTANGGKFSGWTLFSLDLTSGQITTLLQLNSTFDFGNPALGKTRNDLVTFEAIDKQTGISYIYVADMTHGTFGYIGQLGLSGAVGWPDFTGNDRSIIYSQVNLFATTGYDLVQQQLAADNLTTSGSPTTFFGNCDVVSMYRRGAYTSSNALPTVLITSPANGALFAPSSTVTIQASASDTAGGAITKVEFYQGSTKLGEKTSAPYTFNWSNVPMGKYVLTARATDNIGGITDSSQVTVYIGTSPKILNPKRLNATTFQFSVMGDAGAKYKIEQSSDLKDWTPLTTVTNLTGTISVQDTGVNFLARRFYRAVLQ